MITAEIKPEELAQGYEGRLLHLNPEHNRRSLREAMAREAGLSDATPPIFHLAAFAGIDVTAFVCGHTNIPFHRIAVQKQRYRPGSCHGDATELGLLRQLGVPHMNAARFCRKCVEKDPENHHLSYWRRVHQIPGVDWCPTHRGPLTEARHPIVWDRLPSDQLDIAEDLQVEPLEEWPVLERYLTLVEHVLDLRQPVCTSDLRNALKVRASESGLRSSKLGNRPLLSDLAKKSLPAGWIQRHLPTLNDKPSGQYLHVMDSALRSINGARHLTYVLALALLYPSADQALQILADLQNLPEQGVTQPAPLKRYSSAFWESEQLRALYVQCKGSHGLIARTLGVSYSHVRFELNARRLPTLGLIRDRTAIAAALDFREGNSLDSAISEHGADKAQVEHWLRQDLQLLAPLLRARLA